MSWIVLPPDPHPAMPDLYIPQPVTKRFLAKLSTAFDSPANHPILFHVWGTGGVGKSTLLTKTTQQLSATPTTAWVTFDHTVSTPLTVLRLLHRQLSTDKTDTFYTTDQGYHTTLEQLKADTVLEGERELLTKFSHLSLKGISLSFDTHAIGEDDVPDPIPAGAINKLGLSLFDKAQDLIARHPLIHKAPELQSLMVNPLHTLTDAFVRSLQANAADRPILLVLDGYEKVPDDVDRWLCNLLVGHPLLKTLPIRIISAGRQPLSLHWPTKAFHEQQLGRFDPDQTVAYIQKIGITDKLQVYQITQATEGLPYYLDWVRHQYCHGQTPEFPDGSQVLKQLLFKQFTPQQIQLIKVVACCRYFNPNCIKPLMRNQSLELPLAVGETASSRWHWLTSLSFVKRAEYGYQLDDVVRDMLREILHEENPQQFYKAHQILADYYLKLAEEEMWDGAHISAQYESEKWRRYQTMALYHLLFSQPDQAQQTFQSRVLEGAYFSVGEVVQEPLRAIEAEGQGDHPLLTQELQLFLQRIRPLVNYGFLLSFDELPYGLLEQELNISPASIEKALETCWHGGGQLTGLAKFAAYFYQVKHGSMLQPLAETPPLEEGLSLEIPQEDPDSFVLHLGDSLFRLGRYDEAIVSYDEELKHQGDQYEAWHNRGIALDKLGRYDEAIASYNQAIKVKQDYHQAWNNRGIALHQLKRCTDAISSYDEALKHRYDKHEAWYNRGNSMVDLGRFDDAIASYNRALQLKPDYHQAWNNLGNTFGKLENYIDAIASYDHAIAIKPDKDETLYNRACCYALLGNSENALVNLHKAIILIPDEYRAMAKKDADFDKLRDNPLFQALVHPPD